jgi:hypothetical protein
LSRYFWDFLVMLSAIVWIVTLVSQGYISLSFGAFALVAILFFTALARGMGGNIGRLVRFLSRVGLPLSSCLTFLVIIGGGDFRNTVGVLSALGVLLVALIGLYIVFLGFFSGFRSRK